MVPPENENAESGDNGNDNADGGPQVEVNDVQQQQAQGGPSGDTGNYPNAETYSSKPKGTISVSRKGKISNTSYLPHCPKIVLKRSKIPQSWPCKPC